ncbi:MAG: hypothetical protein M0Z55_12930, partial [Peptococcaceae bacterium]|nr:hypothetical protein [Peptococcaceae bacterium]
TFNIDVQTDMATSAFYANEPTVADKAFKTAIAKQPNFLKARLNYGIFLYDAMNNAPGAKAQLEIVAKQTQDPTSAQSAKDLLQQIK